MSDKLLNSNHNKIDTVFLNRVCLILALSVVVLFSFHTITDSDMGYHLSAGRWMTENLSWPDTDAFTYTVSSHKYVDMHWLYQLTAYGIYSLGGDFLYVLFHSVFILLAFFLVIRQKRLKGVSPLVLSVLVIIGAIASEHRFSVRPEVISWTLMVIMIIILDKYVIYNRDKLYLLPLIMLLWVNIQGIFVIGLGIIVCYLLDDLIKKRKIDFRFWFIGFLSFCVTFINPWGWKGTLFPLILSNRLSGANRFSVTIGEFLSPWSLSFPDPDQGTQFMLAAYYILAVLVPVLLILTFRKRPLRDWFLTVMFGILAYQSIRNIPLYFLATFPVAAEAIRDIANWVSKKSPVFTLPKLMKTGFTTIFLLMIFLLNIFILNGTWQRVSKKTWEPGYRITNSFLPLKAVNFLNENKIKGKILNELRHGGYLTWEWRHPIFIDGRLEVMQHEFYKEYELAKRHHSPWMLVDKWQPRIVLFSYAVLPAWFQQFYNSADWRLVYLDNKNTIFIYKDQYPEISTLTPEKLFSATVSEYSEVVDLSAIIDGDIEASIPNDVAQFRSLITGRPGRASTFYNFSMVMQLMNKPDYAEGLLRLGLYLNQGFHADSWYQLGRFAAARKNYVDAARYFSAAISLNSNHQKALLDRDRLEILFSR